MLPENKTQYLKMIPRVFIRAVRDPVSGFREEEYELSEGEATDLLIKREQAAYIKGLRCAADLLRVEVDAIEIGMKKDAGVDLSRAHPGQDDATETERSE